MRDFDWLNTPLEKFVGRTEDRGDGTVRYVLRPHGEGAAQNIIAALAGQVGDSYYALMECEDAKRMETDGEVPVVRGETTTYESLERLTLADLPVILETLATLQDEYDVQKREEKERKVDASKARRRRLDRERRKRKALGEW